MRNKKAWLKHYAKQTDQAYFIIESLQGEPLGTVRLYDAQEHSFCWGSWILKVGAPQTVAIESALMVYAYAIDYLKFQAAHFDVRKGNESVLRFHERFGALRTSETSMNFSYKINFEGISTAQNRYRKYLPQLININSRECHQMSNQDFKAVIDSSAIIMPGAYIGLDVIIEDKVTIGPNAVILGKDENVSATAATIRSGAVIGANATVLVGITVGIKAVVKPGSVVTRTVPPLAIVEGNPAIITGYVSTAISITDNQGKDKKELTKYSKVNNVTFSNLTLVSDLRGNLSVGEFEKDIPFKPNRYFLVFDVPTAETRGEHAHKVCKQFLVCIKGSCNVVADDGVNREEFVLDSPAKGLYLPPMTWGIQYHYSPDACLLVFASEYYDSADYIRDYDEFIKAVFEKTNTTKTI